VPDAKFSDFSFSIIKHRGSPNEAFTLDGKKVTKEEFVYVRIPTDMGYGLRAGDWIKVKCADYHGEHFVYLDPAYNSDDPKAKGRWFAMCTCGSPAVIVEPGTAMTHETNATEKMLVCYEYTATIIQYGVGSHGTAKRKHRKWA
jgi:hypothetical protein